MAYKQKSPYKFLGKLVKGVGKVAGGVLGGAASLLGGKSGGGGGQAPAWVQKMGMLGGPMGMMATGGFKPGGMGMPFMKKEKGYSPYKKGQWSSPLKTDAILVKGAYDAASGKGTAKYGQIAQARAFTDMVDSVERTVNRSSAAQLQKDKTRSKRTVKAHDKYADWREKYERREHERERHQSKRRNARNKHRENIGKPPVPDYNYDNYDDQNMQHGDASVFWKKGKK